MGTDMRDADQAVARRVYAIWLHNGRRLGDAINRAGVDVEALPAFVVETLTDTFHEWAAAERNALAG